MNAIDKLPVVSEAVWKGAYDQLQVMVDTIRLQGMISEQLRRRMLQVIEVLCSETDDKERERIPAYLHPSKVERYTPAGPNNMHLHPEGHFVSHADYQLLYKSATGL